MLNLDLAVGGAKRSRQQGVAMVAGAPGEIRDFAAKSRFCTPHEYFTYPCQLPRGARGGAPSPLRERVGVRGKHAGDPSPRCDAL